MVKILVFAGFFSKVLNYIGFSKSSIYWTCKRAGKRYLTIFINAISFLINKCLLTIGNLVFKQDIGISMDIDILTNLFLYFFESKYITQLLSLNIVAFLDSLVTFVV